MRPPYLPILRERRQLLKGHMLWHILEHVGPVAFIKLDAERQLGQPVAWCAQDMAEPFPLSRPYCRDYVICLRAGASLAVYRATREASQTTRVSAIDASLEPWGERPRLTTIGHEAHYGRFVDI